MVRMLAAVAALIGLVSLAPAVPVPLTVPPREVGPLYFPTTVGARWVYRTDDQTHTKVTTGVEPADRGFRVMVGCEVSGRVVPETEFVVSTDGVASLGTAALRYNQPCWELKPPGSTTRRWAPVLDVADFGAVGPGRVTAHPAEWVEVPAGRFRAVRVEVEFEVREVKLRCEEWWAPGVGRVKTVLDGRVTVLESFTPGK